MRQEVNLYQPHRGARQSVQAMHVLLASALLAVVLGGINAWDRWQVRGLQQDVEALVAEERTANRQLAALGAELAEAGEPEGDGELAQLREQLAARRAALQILGELALAGEAGFASHLQGLARQLTEDVWLTRIVLWDAGRRIYLVGHASAPGHVTELITALGMESAYSGQTFRQLSIDRSDEGALRFELASAPASGLREVREP